MKGITKVFVYIIIGALALVSGCFGFVYFTIPYTEVLESDTDVYFSMNDKEVQLATSVTPTDDSVSVHFLELGNRYTGDCTYIKVGKDIDILIDCGSKATSVGYVKDYLNQYVTDGILEYVIITHAHEDHYAGFATSPKVDSIFDLFYCNTIIYTNTTDARKQASQYKNFQRELDESKAKVDGVETTPIKLTSLECVNQGKTSWVIDEANNFSMEILNTKYYSNPAVKSKENENSVCTLFKHGDKNFLFTGDLEKDGEKSLVELNTLPKVDLYKAGHHGSKTSSSVTLLEQIMKTDGSTICCICCCAGSSEYTTTIKNQFPTLDFINRISQYTTYVYVTTMCIDYKNSKFQSFNGNIAIISANSISVYCSNNTTLLKDSDWFKENRLEMCKSTLSEDNLLLADSWQ